MAEFKVKIHKTKEYKKMFIQVDKQEAGLVCGNATQNGIRMYFYLVGNRDGNSWTVTPSAFAEWCGGGYTDEDGKVMDQNTRRRWQRAIELGVRNLVELGYLVEEDGYYNFYEFGGVVSGEEQKVPKESAKGTRSSSKDADKEHEVPNERQVGTGSSSKDSAEEHEVPNTTPIPWDF